MATGTLETRPSQILIIDDDRDLCTLLGRYLLGEGFVVDAAPDGEVGLAMLGGGDYKLVVLDIGLPGLDGLDVLHAIRGRSSVPVVMLTASGDVEYRIRGLQLGADDYLPKPFDPEELLLRVQAVLRRTESGSVRTPPETLVVGDVEADAGCLEVRCGGVAATLTPVEFRVLRVLMERAGLVVSRDELAGLALQRSLGPLDRALDVHISKIRRKLGPRPDGRPRIKTIRGEGYQFVRPT